ncbi:hypothetical protein M3Y97_00624300 [Aphelenchoides bicaudatus]|nr:hypothetical protein M3Y97_00624300 [Aphelenchoides bicaudatus]
MASQLIVEYAWGQQTEIIMARLPAMHVATAFFRRSIIQRRNYYCTKHDCKITGDERSKKICKACRFKKCVEVGMIIDSVWRRRLLEESDQFQETTTLQKMLKARQATFMNKINIMSKMSVKMNIKMAMGSLKPSKEQTELSKLSEFEVLMQYMRDMGFEDLGLDQIDMARIAGTTYYKWMLCSAIVVTLRNSGLYTNTVYFSDRGHLPATYDECKDFLTGHGGFLRKNLPILSSTWYSVLRKGMQIGRNVHSSKLDKTEFSALTFLMVLQQAQKLFPNNKLIDAQINTLFKEINKYFKENYADTALRLGNLVLLLNDLDSILPEVHEFAGLLIISGYDIILHRALRSYGLMDTLN